MTWDVKPPPGELSDAPDGTPRATSEVTNAPVYDAAGEEPEPGGVPDPADAEAR